MTRSTKAVLVISSHVVRGSVGNRAAVFALEALGFPVWAVPTVTLAWHPGHGRASPLVPDRQGFSALLEDIARAPWLDELAGVVTGYMASGEQAADVAKLVALIKEQNSDLLYVCDPVIGDEAGLYVAEQTAQGIERHLLPLADVITPNRFELQYLARRDDLETAAACAQAARALGARQALVTSVPGFFKNHIGNCLVDGSGTCFCEHRRFDNPPNGTGDLTAALFLANRLRGVDAETALARTTASVFEILSMTLKAGANELVLEGNWASLERPRAMVNTRQLAGDNNGAGGAKRPAPKRL